MFFTTGGFPFGDGDAFARPRREINNTRFYETLGVSKDASTEQIKRAYRKLAMIHHPDKKDQRGDAEKFKEISRAYEILSDPDKRRQYDTHGEESLDGQAGGDPTDIFDLFMGGGKPRGPAGKRRGEDIESLVKVSLEQIYNGATRKMAINREVLCASCDGIGGPKDALDVCPYCDGTGVRVQIRRFGPMTQQTRTACPTCRQGKVMAPEKCCKRCGGEGTVKERKILEVYIEKGVPDTHRITFTGEADHRPDTIPGDVRFIVQQEEHPVFTRKEEHLFMIKKITLFEALTGYRFMVTHLDDRKLLIESPPGEITQHGKMKIIKHEGMPIHKSPFDKGHLIIEIQVELPSRDEFRLQGDELKAALRRILPVPKPLDISTDDPNVDGYVATDLSPEDINAKSSKRGNAYDEDGDDESAPRVQCRPQ